jgi:uncharacterized protein
MYTKVMPTTLLARGLQPSIERLLRAVPVVILEGARAAGKTSLGVALCNSGAVHTLADLSDPTTFAAAEASPTSFVAELQTPALIDEAQLLPALAVAVKRRVDREAKNGLFVLTGSSRLGRTQLGGSDPLAGRAVRLRLCPLTQGELAGNPVNLVESLIQSAPAQTPAGAGITRADLIERIRRGGLPPLTGLRGKLEAGVREQLAQEYLEAVLLHEVGARHDRAELLRLYRYLAASTARLANVSTIGSELGAVRSTVSARLASLDACFLLHSVAGHRPSEHRTLTAHPKLHATDTGLAAWAARMDASPTAALFGAMLETLVVNELLAQAAWLISGPTIRHWRDTAKKLEVDAVILQSNGASMPVEIKAGADIRPDDLKGLREYLATVAGATRGIAFYTGERTQKLAENIWAVPISALWTGFETTPPRKRK